MLGGPGTKLRENNLRVKQKFYEIRAIDRQWKQNMQIGLYWFLLDRQRHGVERLSLCGSEVIQQSKQLEVEGERVPMSRSWRRQ